MQARWLARSLGLFNVFVLVLEMEREEAEEGQISARGMRGSERVRVGWMGLRDEIYSIQAP